MADEQNQEVPEPFAGEPDYLEYKSLIKRNNTKSMMLQASGVSLDGASMMQHRLELFIEMVLPHTDRKRLDFELAWQRILSASLQEADNQVARATLLAPGKMPIVNNPGENNVIQIPRSS